MTKAFAVVLYEASLETLREVISPYVHRTEQDALPYLLSERADQDGVFLSCAVLIGNGTPTWDVRISLHFVLAIVDVSEAAPGIGFLSQAT